MMQKELELICNNFREDCGKQGCEGLNVDCPNYEEGQTEVKYFSLEGDKKGIKVIKGFSFLKTEEGYSLH